MLGNPKAWLGTAYHEVLQALPMLAAEEVETSVQQRAEAIWNQAIERLEHQASLHPLNHRFGSALTWKGYYLVLETLRIRVRELTENINRQYDRSAGYNKENISTVSREKEFNALAGKLRGRIDLVQGDEIIDYKTGTLFDNDTGDSPPSLKAAYVRQLRIYAYLVHSATGKWPRRGLLFPLAGQPVIVGIEPTQCETEAAEAVELLERYNSSVATAEEAIDLASPSSEACRWCSFKAICPAFWMNVNEGWTSILDGEAVAGRLTKPPLALHGGAAWSVAVRVEAGTVPQGEWLISPLSTDLHPSVPHLGEGEHVRITGLGRRSNGSLFPTQRTVVLAVAAVPNLGVPSPQACPEVLE
jgi:hypothetical protein